MSYFAQAIYALYPEVATTVGDKAFDANGNQVNYDLSYVQDYENKIDTSEKAKTLIQKTDWAVLPDVGLTNQSDFIEYRKTLRNYIINPVADPEWPAQPTAQGSQ